MIRRPPRSTLFPYTSSSDLYRRATGELIRVDSTRRIVNHHGRRYEIVIYRESVEREAAETAQRDRKSTRLNSSHGYISYAVFCLKKKKAHKRFQCRD